MINTHFTIWLEIIIEMTRGSSCGVRIATKIALLNLIRDPYFKVDSTWSFLEGYVPNKPQLLKLVLEVLEAAY